MPGTEAKRNFRLEEDSFKKYGVEINGRGQENRPNDNYKEKLISNSQ